MVVFTCNHCGETLHKPKVEKHYQFQCRNFKSVTCVDCFKDFRNDEYTAHTKCITEDERYAAKGTYATPIIKKGEVKQESWLEMIKSICNVEQNLKPSIRRLLETISEYSNVPRKRVKFMNFIKSSSGNRVNMQEVEEVWNIIEKYKSQNLTPVNNNVKKETEDLKNDTDLNAPKKRASENNSYSDVPPQKKSKISKLISSNENDETKDNNKKEQKDNSLINQSENLTNSDNSVHFDFKTKILEIVSKKQSISQKKLQKKVLKAYYNITGQSDCDEAVIKKINKKLKKIPSIKVDEERVVLVV